MKDQSTDPKETTEKNSEKNPAKKSATNSAKDTGKPAETGKTTKTAKAAKPGKTTKTGKATKPTKPTKAGKETRTGKRNSTNKAGGAKKSAKAEGASKASDASAASGASDDTEKIHSELYESMSAILKEHLQRAGTLTEEVFERALKEAMEYAEQKRAHYREDIARVSEYLKRDWHAAIRFARDQTQRSLNLDRWQAGILGVLSSLAKSAGEQLENFANKINDRLTYKSGEVAGAGNLACTKCGQQLTFEKATRIPPCPKCQNDIFRRTF